MTANKKSVQIGLGICSILMIFVVLCMAVLSLLSYREAQQKYDIAKRQQTYRQAYTESDASLAFVIDEMRNTAYSDAALYAADAHIVALWESNAIAYDVHSDEITLRKAMNAEQYIEAQLIIQDGGIDIVSYQMK